MEELALIHDIMKAPPLPQTRTEFEDWANLFIPMERRKEFLQIKHDFMIAKITGRQFNRPTSQQFLQHCDTTSYP